MKLTQEEIDRLSPEARARYGANSAEPKGITTGANPLDLLWASLNKAHVLVFKAGWPDATNRLDIPSYLPISAFLHITEAPNGGGYDVKLSSSAGEIAADHQRKLDDVVKLCVAFRAAAFVSKSVEDVAEAFAAFDPRLAADEIVRRIEVSGDN